MEDYLYAIDPEVWKSVEEGRFELKNHTDKSSRELLALVDSADQKKQ